MLRLISPHLGQNISLPSVANRTMAYNSTNQLWGQLSDYW